MTTTIVNQYPEKVEQMKEVFEEFNKKLRKEKKSSLLLPDVIGYDVISDKLVDDNASIEDMLLQDESDVRQFIKYDFAFIEAPTLSLPEDEQEAIADLTRLIKYCFRRVRGDVLLFGITGNVELKTVMGLVKQEDILQPMFFQYE